MPYLISIVDDDASFRLALTSLLQSLDYTVAAFESAEKFLASGVIDETACLISDVALPGMSGYELQARLREAGHPTPIIFVAGSPGAKTRAQAIASGALAFLGKPFAEDRLIALLGQVERDLGSS